MANRKEEVTGKGIINLKVLNALGVKKQQVGKTIFRLPPADESFLRQLAKISKKTIRDFLDSLAEIAEKTPARELPDLPNSLNGKRMSYAISKEAKETFSRLARERGTSRDNIVRATLAYIAKQIDKNALTPQKKIEYARILADAQERMLEIYDSDQVAEAREKLSACGDQDFSRCDEKFIYIGQLNELKGEIEDFIRRKQDEID